MPSFIRNVVEAVAEIKKMQVEDVAQQISKNFEGFFNIKLR
jgi:Tat protein secretion system quality control protein TatD with DNase activity